MTALQGTNRVVLLGAGMGLVLLGIEVGEVHVGLRGATALVGLIPVAVSVTLGGPIAAAVAVGIAVLGVGGALGGTAAVVVAMRHAVPGLALGVVLARRLSLPASLIIVGAASLLGLLLLLGAYLPSGSMGLSLLGRQLDAHVADLDRLVGWFGVTSDPTRVAESARLLAGAMRIAGPGILLVGLLVVSLTNYVGARVCLRGRAFRAFADESVPDHLVWGVIAAGLMLVSQHETAQRVGLNLLIVLAPLYAIQGLAVLRHFFQKAKVPRPLQGVSFGLFAVQPLLLIGAAGLGLSDLWVDFRGIRRVATSP
ncbi:MAG: DUF2232 domain-containing protein [Candidatus Rokubacteria bacterium]|nr:DUF2232 domain-containing protein [Candidatus Rokubacteria bacterium]